MPKEFVTMSTKEIDRCELIRRVREKRLTQARAAALMGLSVRQVVLLVRERYADFGPKLAHEKLVEVHGIRVGRETLLGWLAEAGVWLPRAEPTPCVHQPAVSGRARAN
jgi:predicted DNA-binding protein (UPF0251 family)